MGSAHLLDLAEVEREFVLFLQEKDLSLMDAAAWLFCIYPLFDDNAMTIMETMKVPLLNQISQMASVLVTKISPTWTLISAVVTPMFGTWTIRKSFSA